jgi:hypothetical protein
MTIKVGDVVARRVANGAPPGETGVVLEIIRGARSAIYRIRWASGQEQECRPGSFRANRVRAPGQQVGNEALVQPPVQVAIAAEPPNEDNPPSDDESEGSSEGSVSSADVPNAVEGLIELIEQVGGAIAPPDVPAGGAIAMNAPNAPVQAAPVVTNVNGVIWEAIDAVNVDLGLGRFPDPHIQWFRAIGNPAADVAANKDIFDCFRLFFPEQIMQTILDLTNHNIAADATRIGGAISRGELLKYFGLRLAMALEPCGSIDNYWNKPGAPNETLQSIRQPRNFGDRFGMSRNRFRCIERNLQYGVRDERDKWWRVRGLIEAFNDRMAYVYEPSEFVTVDELMSVWLGKDGAYYAEGLAHVTKMKSKPRGVGLMMKAMADGETKIICSLELQEGKEVIIIIQTTFTVNAIIHIYIFRLCK